MSDIKKIIEEEKRKKQAEEEKARESFRKSKVWQQSSSNNLKAEKLLTFADSVIQRFSRETNLHFQPSPPIGTLPSKRMANWFIAPLRRRLS